MSFKFDPSKIPFLIELMEKAIQDGREWGLDLLNESKHKHGRKKIAIHAINMSTLWSIGKGIATGIAGLLALPADLVDTVYSQVKLSATLFTIRGYDTANEGNWVFIVAAAIGISVHKLAKYLGVHAIKALNKVLLPKSFRILMKMNQTLAIKFGAKIFGKNVVKVAKAVPAIGGVIGGGVNGVTMLLCGRGVIRFMDDWGTGDDWEMEGGCAPA
ncbi:hypothetical protein GFS31_02860 [Leptolyngbya sp. BL0902]|uniref:hypothetical protein n=1 Tax=Leptolyngbya sp. BL0902 TaxID=1115757 RepID=UPI0018E860B4|nr:hypothetical protein [Leptolyngbya sp. BL0902]QQE63619.1 hypothetical protein GFS31_02860 [Leptolyngbya sp. BL0902]